MQYILLPLAKWTILSVLTGRRWCSGYAASSCRILVSENGAAGGMNASRSSSRGPINSDVRRANCHLPSHIYIGRSSNWSCGHTPPLPFSFLPFSSPSFSFPSLPPLIYLYLGLKCNFKVVETVKIHRPYKNLWIPFNVSAGPLYFCQAVILTKFRLTSHWPLGSTPFPPFLSSSPSLPSFSFPFPSLTSP